MGYRKAPLVDAAPVFRALAEDMLLDADVAEVLCAEDGQRAIDMLAEGADPDLMVCDLNMPAHDGVSLIRAIAEGRYPGKVLVISGEAAPVIDSVVKLARMQGLNILGSIKKPLTQEALVASLSSGAPAPAPKVKAPPEPALPSLLDAAIERGALHPFFQAKVSMADRRISGAEALARIAVTQTDYANPVPYVELAERNNRIDDLTFVMTRLVALHTKNFFVGGRPLPVSINISPVSLRSLQFPDMMANAVEGVGIPASQVTLELTETSLLD